MKITKFVHSCLLVETPGRVGIIDPGAFSWESGLFDVQKLAQLHDIIITHEHADHMHVPFIQALVAQFPQASIVTTQAAAAQLRQADITNVSTASCEEVELFQANHESTEPLGPPPQNTGVHYLGLLTHPGDSHHFDQTKQVLALPITAPWGHVMQAAKLGAQLKPRYIVPVHDWHWRDQALVGMYDRLEQFYKAVGITFIKPVNGQAFELEAS